MKQFLYETQTWNNDTQLDDTTQVNEDDQVDESVGAFYFFMKLFGAVTLRTVAYFGSQSAATAALKVRQTVVAPILDIATATIKKRRR